MVGKRRRKRIRRETRDGYFYSGWPNRYYIIRRLSGQWVHLYPRANGMLPQGFASRFAAQRRVSRLRMFGQTMKVVSGKEASRYEVPKRW